MRGIVATEISPRHFSPFSLWEKGVGGMRSEVSYTRFHLKAFQSTVSWDIQVEGTFPPTDTF